MPAYQDLSIREWLLSRGSIIAAMSYVAHRDERIYPTGSEEDPHPLEEFWAERFLQQQEKPAGATSSEAEKETAPNFSLDGLGGAWIPYGGGSNICPGRHFAKKEILLTAAMLASEFEVCLEEPFPEVDLRFFGTGTLGVKGKAKCRIRRRAS